VQQVRVQGVRNGWRVRIVLRNAGKIGAKTKRRNAMYDIIPSFKKNPNGSITGSVQILRDGQMFTDYSATYFSATVAQQEAFYRHAGNFNSKLVGLTYKQMHATQKEFAQHLFKLGDANKKNK
jgi:hypothetical protein